MVSPRLPPSSSSRGDRKPPFCTSPRPPSLLLIIPLFGRWTIALHGGKLLSAASYSAMTTPASGRESGYGLGTVIGSFAGRRTFFLSGGTSSGARSLVAYFPGDSLAVVLLVNAEPVDLDRVEAAITGAWYDAAPPAAPH